jgi:hypothetical protein
VGRILQFSDVHFGCEHSHACEAAVDFAHAHPSNLILITGDITQKGLPDEFAEAGDWIRRLPDPRFVIVGNHDVPYWSLADRLFHPWRAFETATGHPAHDHQFLSPSVMVRGVVTARGWQARPNWSKGVIDLDQTRKAAAALLQPDLLGRTRDRGHFHGLDRTGLRAAPDLAAAPPSGHAPAGQRAGPRRSRALGAGRHLTHEKGPAEAGPFPNACLSERRSDHGSPTPESAHDQGDDEQDRGDDGDELADLEREAGDAAEAEEGRDQGDDKEDESPAEHKGRLRKRVDRIEGATVRRA